MGRVKKHYKGKKARKFKRSVRKINELLVSNKTWQLSKNIDKSPKVEELSRNETQNNLTSSNDEIQIYLSGSHYELQNKLTRSDLIMGAPPLKQILTSASEVAVVCNSKHVRYYEPITIDSEQLGLRVLSWMIEPMQLNTFFDTCWQKKPLHISRESPTYYNELITTAKIVNLLHEYTIEFAKNIDITSYVDGKTVSHNLVGRALPSLVWPLYLDGCSIRLWDVDGYIPRLHTVNATMQEYFKSNVSTSIHLSAPDSQGTAACHNDVEAFILQSEGKQHWRVYESQNENKELRRGSTSRTYDQDELGEVILDVVLYAGDMIYLPRGYIHQALPVEREHSLHITISTYQNQSWADLFEKLIPVALKMAIKENVELRRGLPIDIFNNFGFVHSKSSQPRRKELKGKISSLFNTIKKYLPIDGAVDQMNKTFMQAALPPLLTYEEMALTAFAYKDEMINGKVINRVEITLDTKIKLIRKGILRMVAEDKLKLYYYVDNSVENRGNELPFLEIEEHLGPGVETLILFYPKYVAVKNLGIQNDREKLKVANLLWRRGLLMTETPLNTIDDGDD